ncbi:hypothetical protein Sliba_70450 [Streptomyces nigrescens]|uniref:Uncharacterized protein n=1 Tax=Streptomyces nigrescens TaxID=1920 RepID=A0A640TUV4_STRNI|nr:hypothetical protein Sliba_70450 [Streptomyces libani subsp. libani]GGW00941.1 hypothetical protein GCM10010500_54940 [Streptomyces libani subsp. libani]
MQTVRYPPGIGVAEEVADALGERSVVFPAHQTDHRQAFTPLRHSAVPHRLRTLPAPWPAHQIGYQTQEMPGSAEDGDIGIEFVRRHDVPEEGSE